MALSIETIDVCPVCMGNQLRMLMQIPDYESATGDYGLVECCDCGLAFTSPRPRESELPSLYAARSTTDFPDASALVRRLRDFAIDSYIAQQLDAVPQFSPAAVLDFGCGDGALSRGLLRHSRAHGLRSRVTAVDFHTEPPASLCSVDPGEIRYLANDRWSELDDRYDAIFLRHVLEHHPDPRRLLTELRRVLTPGGQLFIEVPNRRTVWAAVFGRHYFGYYIPRHLMHFDRGSLTLAVENSGLTCFKLTLGHIPMLGGSIAYRTGWKVAPLGLVALGAYPFQVAVDFLARSSTTLRLIATCVR